jgi:hypothetical protein
LLRLRLLLASKGDSSEKARELASPPYWEDDCWDIRWEPSGSAGNWFLKKS